MDQTVTRRHTISRAPWFGCYTAPTAPWEICYTAALRSSQTLGSLLSFTFLELKKEPVVTFINRQEFFCQISLREKGESWKLLYCSVFDPIIQAFWWVDQTITHGHKTWMAPWFRQGAIATAPTAPWEIPMLCLKGAFVKFLLAIRQFVGELCFVFEILDSRSN